MNVYCRNFTVMIQLSFFKSNELDRNLKASIHKTGKLGFSSDAAAKLKLAESEGVSIAKNMGDEQDRNLYVIVNKEKKEGDFRISKAGEYYYVSAKDLFDNLEWDYTKKNYTFDIKRTEIDGTEVWVFKTNEKEKE